MNIIDKIEYMKKHNVKIVFGFYIYTGPGSELLETDTEIFERAKELKSKIKQMGSIPLKSFTFCVFTSQLEIISYKTLKEIILMADTVIIPDYPDYMEVK